MPRGASARLTTLSAASPRSSSGGCTPACGSAGKPRSQSDAPRMPEAGSARRIPLTMYARSVDEAAARLCELRQEECGDLALAAVSLALAFAATQIRPAFAMPFLL